jgi:hypothetical protein
MKRMSDDSRNPPVISAFHTSTSQCFSLSHLLPGSRGSFLAWRYNLSLAHTRLPSDFDVLGAAPRVQRICEKMDIHIILQGETKVHRENSPFDPAKTPPLCLGSSLSPRGTAGPFRRRLVVKVPPSAGRSAGPPRCSRFQRAQVGRPSNRSLVFCATISYFNMFMIT